MGLARERARRQLGYTLVELMIIVTIIGISITAFAPGFGRAMADRRVSNATRELIRLGRRARAETFGLLRAHTVWLTPATGTVELLRAPTNSCRLTTWRDCAAERATDAATQRCVEQVVLNANNQKVAYREESTSGTMVSTSRALCYAPNGTVYYGSDLNAQNFTDQNLNIAGGLVYALYPSDADPTATTTRMHRVLFPLGSTPRALR